MHSKLIASGISSGRHGLRVCPFLVFSVSYGGNRLSQLGLVVIVLHSKCSSIPLEMFLVIKWFTLFVLRPHIAWKLSSGRVECQ